MTLIKVKDEKNLYRDERSGAIVATVGDEYNEYQRKKQILSDKKQKEKNMEDKINNLESEILELKQLVLALVQKQNG